MLGVYGSTQICPQSFCLHGGICESLSNCHDNITACHTCLCPLGYIGDRCENATIECNQSACLNGGTCIDMVASFQCSCLPQYTGMKCETNGYYHNLSIDIDILYVNMISHTTFNHI